MEYFLHILILIGIYIILSVSLNLVAGYTGLLSVAHAAFYGIGAYVTALLALHFESHFIINILCAMVLSGILGAFIAIPSLRSHDDYFVIATFAFQIIIFSILNNWVSLTKGPMGLPGIPQPVLFGFQISSHIAFLFFVSFFAIITFLAANRLVNSPFGRVLKAIREGEVFAASLGKNVAGFKITVLVVSASLAGIAGSLYAYYITFIDPTSFTHNGVYFYSLSGNYRRQRKFMGFCRRGGCSGNLTGTFGIYRYAQCHCRQYAADHLWSLTGPLYDVPAPGTYRRIFF